MPYVIVRLDSNEYVAPPHEGKHSYCANIEKAALFQTKEQAERECVGDEIVGRIDTIDGRLVVVIDR